MKNGLLADGQWTPSYAILSIQTRCIRVSRRLSSRTPFSSFPQVPNSYTSRRKAGKISLSLGRINYQQLEIVRNEFPQLRIVSLCQPHETGYRHQAFEHLPAHEKKESIIRLLTSVDILLHCCAFVGTITSGPSVFLLKVRADDPCVTAIDCLQDMLPDCLSLNIEERAAISRRFVIRLT